MIHRYRYQQQLKEGTVADNDVPFEKKMDVLTWRGSNTGNRDRCSNGHYANRSRRLLVDRYSLSEDHRIDVGFGCHGKSDDDFCKGMHMEDAPTSWSKDFQNVKEQLTKKYIMVVEGNDVASSAVWVL